MWIPLTASSRCQPRSRRRAQSLAAALRTSFPKPLNAEPGHLSWHVSRLMAAALPSMIYGSAGQLAHRAHEVFLRGLRVDGGGVDVHVPGEALDQPDVARLAIEIRTRGMP